MIWNLGKETTMKIGLLGIICCLPILVVISGKSISPDVRYLAFKEEVFYEGEKDDEEYVLKEVESLQSSLDELTSRIDHFLLETMNNDPDWKFFPNTYISGRKINHTKSLEEAKKQCKKTDDCVGITRENGDFELRVGPKTDAGTSGQHSWILNLEKCNDPLKEEFMINIDILERNYKDLRGQRFRRPDGRCIYNGQFSHVNKLLEYNPSLKFTTLHSPSTCNFDNSSESGESILFGIKSMPGAADFRQSIRDTWLNPDLWKQLGFQIKVVFIIGLKSDEDLTEEMREHDDLLISDFVENQYVMPYKFLALWRFMEDKCFTADFVFMGDDDTLVVPQNLINEISKIKSSPSIEAIGCKKEAEPVCRNPKIKYFIPKQVYGKPKWPRYMSGGGFLTTGEFTRAVAKAAREEKLVIPLDDTWTGMLIEKIGKGQNMARSEGICMGLMENFSVHDTCATRGLAITHKVIDSDFMRSAFADLISENFKCDAQNMKTIQTKVRKMRNEKQTVWKENFLNFKTLNFTVPNLS
ncbi:Oidioi.mRNA.OKI2018_I69.chr1.g3881.t1.cds [Oikopleura dioica]|uniref:Oidioi.mRNA.OKI2018_I69.chr1.g3881.t1.cds n=1 Tax=Oikopleura dioica TaxID=34765 RepID=A0ABN7SZG3_OIKDI|nr:Oidioi.mRNA.OKI2018_I69.chr1.g3881.t1.cds [Oikopleura dioica]